MPPSTSTYKRSPLLLTYLRKINPTIYSSLTFLSVSTSHATQHIYTSALTYTKHSQPRIYGPDTTRHRGCLRCGWGPSFLHGWKFSGPLSRLTLWDIATTSELSISFNWSFKSRLGISFALRIHHQQRTSLWNEPRTYRIHSKVLITIISYY